MKHIYRIGFIGLLLTSLASCGDDDTIELDSPPVGNTNFLSSRVAALGAVDLGGLESTEVFPESNTVEGDHPFAPSQYNGQLTRRAQLNEIVDHLRDQPITFPLRQALGDGSVFVTAGANSTTEIRTKIDELNFDAGDESVAESFDRLADSLQNSSENFNTIASNGVAGTIITGTTQRHVSANGLEYAQILEKGLFGPLFYDQIVDDYTRPSQAGAENNNNSGEAGVDFAAEGTGRQHGWDEAFGYFGINDLETYPNLANTSDGDGEFIANYTFDFSDETEATFGVNIAQQIYDSYIFGRAVLKAGEGITAANESVNEVYYEAARADVRLYAEAGLAAAAYHYLNLSIADVDEADRLHHLSEALGFIYSLAFNSDGLITESQTYNVLEELGWPASDSTLDGIYEINLWEVTDAQMQAAIAELDQYYPGFSTAGF